MSDDRDPLKKEPGDIDLAVPTALVPRLLAAQAQITKAGLGLMASLAATQNATSVELRRASLAPARAALDEWEAAQTAILDVSEEILVAQQQLHSIDLSLHRGTIVSNRSTMRQGLQAERSRLDALEIALKDVTGGSFGKA